MVTTKLLILLCTYEALASHHSHTIPVEGYETKLLDLGQHVDIPETPVKIIKITKTIAVKVPVPYPVKVIQKVPYPVHVSKPYPVPVPQIIKVPAAHAHTHAHGEQHAAPAPAHPAPPAHDYGVQEAPAEGPYAPAGDAGGHSFGNSGEGSYGDAGAGHFGASGGGGGGGGYESAGEGQQLGGHEGYGSEQSYAPAGHAPANNEGSFEYKSYDNALNEYFKNHPAAGHY